MINLLDFDLKELESFVVELGLPKFRAKQIFDWEYKGASDFSEFKNLGNKDLEKIKEVSRIGQPEVITKQVSSIDGTRKYLLGLSDENCVEAVFMKYKFGNSICISSQAGCRMGCKFCASTIGGLKRNLTAGEMVGEILAVQKDTNEKISHIVVMGTGEPFDNYDNLSKFLRLANSQEGLGIGMRNITVSTCGIVPMIYKFAEDFDQVNLAISLHHTNNESRSSLMPINKKYPIEELLKACKDYTLKTNRRITFEYTLVKDKNDSKEDALALSKLLSSLLCHVNLIPLNVVKETGLETTNKEKAIEFQKILENNKIPCTIRRELGDDIDAACGQLRLSKKD